MASDSVLFLYDISAMNVDAPSVVEGSFFAILPSQMTGNGSPKITGIAFTGDDLFLIVATADRLIRVCRRESAFVVATFEALDMVRCWWSYMMH